MSSIRNPKGPHHAEHEPGGVDALVALDGSVITTGAVPAARGGTGVTTGLTVINGASVTSGINAANVTAGTLPDAVHSTNVAMRNAINQFTNENTITYTNPLLYFADISQPANQKLWALSSAVQTFRLYSATDVGALTAPTFNLQLDRSGSLKVATDIYEKQRTTPMGHWIDVPYSAGNFFGNVGTWTVEAADVNVCAYTLIGKTMILSFWIAGSSVSGSPLYLHINLPPGFTPLRQSIVLISGYDNAVYVPWCYCRAVIGDPKLYIARTDSAGWQTSANQTQVYGQIAISLV